jgi:TonB family protein
MAFTASALAVGQTAPKPKADTAEKAGCPELNAQGVTPAKLSESEARNIVRVQQRPAVPPVKTEQKVAVQIFVNADGQVVCAHLQSPGSADKQVEDRTLEAAKKFAFIPYRVKGREYPFESTLTFMFRP